MRKFGHWTPRYICNRIQNKAYHFIFSDRPWLTPQAANFLQNWLRTSDQVFEWGAGKSTIWIARRTHSIVSVETDAEWFKNLQSRARQENLCNIDLKFFSSQPTGEDESNYVSFIAAAGGPFDLIIVDSLYRDACALSALDHLRPGGLLLIDNINWYLPSNTVSPASRRQAEAPATPGWKDFSDRVKTWRRMWTSNGVWDTAIWVKPAAS